MEPIVCMTAICELTYYRFCLVFIVLILVFSQAVASPNSGDTLIYEGNFGGKGITVTGVFQPNGLKAHPSIENPIITGNNLYAPDLVRMGPVWNLYYGGWKHSNQENDQIYFAISDDLLPEGPWSGQSVIISNGDYLNVNDPSVQNRGPQEWVMAYTVAKFEGDDYRDWIAISTSIDGESWVPSQANDSVEIQIARGEFSDIARPSLLWTGSVWKLWFDGRADNSALTNSYLAESNEDIPLNFTLVHSYDDANGFPGFFEPDVEFVNGRYVAVIQRQFNTLLKVESLDGINFTETGIILTSSDPAFKRSYVSNPGLLYDDVDDTIRGVAYGMTDNPAFVDHDIGFAYTQYTVNVLSCPSTWHVFTNSQFFGQAIQLTFEFNNYCRILITNSLDNRVLVDQEVNSIAGDRWKFVKDALATAQNGLFISEYVEGSSNNKAIEIVNGTGSTIADLSAYKIGIYNNGSTTPMSGMSLNAVSLNNLDVFVLSHTSADQAILNAADQTSGSLSFNGNDVVALQQTDGTNIDVIGQIGGDPGTEWGSGLASTQNNTLRRKSSVNAGDSDGSDAFDPAGEWDGFAQDTFDGLGSHIIDNPLPVELSSFTYSVIDGNVKLIWTTATELNNYGFQIERRKITDAWQSVGFVKGKGTTTQSQYYEYVDVNVEIGNYDYRLKQIDTDGSFEYSQVLSVSLRGPVTTRLAQNYPNPFNPTTTISFSMTTSDLVTLKIYNILGKEINTLVNEFREPGAYSSNFDASKLASGVYFYKLRVGNDFVEAKKMLLMR